MEVWALKLGWKSKLSVTLLFSSLQVGRSSPWPSEAAWQVSAPRQEGEVVVVLEERRGMFDSHLSRKECLCILGGVILCGEQLPSVVGPG